MNYTEHKITLDIHQTVSQATLCVKKGDTGRRLLIHLAEKGYPYHISEDCYAVFTAVKPDSKVLFNDCSVDGCVIIYEFTEQTVAAVGRMECEIILYGGNGKQLTSASFHIIVEDTIYDTETEIESTSEYNALASLIAQVHTVVTKGLAAPPIIKEAVGEVINVSDASDKGLHGLRIFGKSTQAAVPTLDSPVEIVSLTAPVVSVTDGTEDNVQTLAITTPGSLAGIPVDSGGNYTDSNGQQWICDEVDLARGVYIQRVRRVTISDFSSAAYGEVGSYARVWFGVGNANYSSIDTPNGMSNIMPMLGNYSADQLHFYMQNQQLWVFVPIDELEENTIEGARKWLTNKGAVFQYILETPIETELTAEEIVTFATLHTYKPNTAIYTDVGAGITAEYVADTKIYVDSMISGTILAATVE